MVSCSRLTIPCTQLSSTRTRATTTGSVAERYRVVFRLVSVAAFEQSHGDCRSTSRQDQCDAKRQRSHRSHLGDDRSRQQLGLGSILAPCRA